MEAIEIQSKNKLALTNGKKTLHLSPKESIDLELKLNVSPYGRTWIKIGDALYKYGTQMEQNILVVSDQQYEYLKDLKEGNLEV